MRLKFILRTVIDIRNFKNKTCWTCKHLEENDMCYQPDPIKEKHEITYCPRYIYIRTYKRL